MVPDNWNFNGSNPCLYHGGNYNQNQNHGPFYVNYNRTSNSNDNIGCRILAKLIFDLNDLFVQAVIAVSPMAGVHFLNCQTKVFVRYDLFVNSNSFHQGCFSSL